MTNFTSKELESTQLGPNVKTKRAYSPRQMCLSQPAKHMALLL